MALRFGRALYGPDLAGAAPYVRAQDQNLMQTFINVQSKAGTISDDLKTSEATIDGDRATVVLLGTFCSGASVRNEGTSVGSGLDGESGSTVDASSTTSEPGPDGGACFESRDAANPKPQFVVTLERDSAGRWKVVLSNDG